MISDLEMKVSQIVSGVSRHKGMRTDPETIATTASGLLTALLPATGTGEYPE